MAEFCRTCALETLGFDTKDFPDSTTPVDTEAARFATVLGEGCGVIKMGHHGCRVRDPSGRRRTS